MPEWLTAAVGPEPAIPIYELVLRLVIAVALGVAVAAVYFRTQRKTRAEAAAFVATLVLLTILLAMVSMVIGGNIARAFSLVGALSIVRFRTVVEDTRDTAFVIFAVVVGLAVGAGVYAVPVVGVPVVGLAAWGLSAWGGDRRSPAAEARPAGVLVVRVGIAVDPSGTLSAALARHLDDSRLTAAATARQGAALDLTYAVWLKPGGSAVALVAELNRVEGVQGVEWKDAAG